MRRSAAALVAALALAFAMALGACSDDGKDDGETERKSDADASTTSASATGATLQATANDLGEVVVDVDGRSLYVFAEDTGTEGTCTAACAEEWPPLTVEGEPTAGPGVDASEVGVTERDDGTGQVTYGGHPLYRFSGDANPGEANGQDSGGVWYVIGLDGEPITSAGDQDSGY